MDFGKVVTELCFWLTGWFLFGWVFLVLVFFRDSQFVAWPNLKSSAQINRWIIYLFTYLLICLFEGRSHYLSRVVLNSKVLDLDQYNLYTLGWLTSESPCWVHVVLSPSLFYFVFTWRKRRLSMNYICIILNLWHLFINLIQGRILEKEKLFPKLKV